MGADPKLDVGHLTHPGRVRERNEDGYGLPPPDLSAEVLAAKGRLYLVADGMGGHEGGERASQLAVQVIMREYYGAPSSDPQHSLARAIRLANAEIYREAQSQPRTQKMGTTVTAVVIRGRDVLVANVGDSRTYLLRGESMRQLTRDHSLVADGLRDGTISAEQAATHPYRSVITRALGVEESVLPDFFGSQLRPGDRFLLCSDGLTNEVRDSQIAGLMLQGKTAQAASGNLVEQALGHGARDNVTALVVGIGSTGGPVGVGGARAPAAVPTSGPPKWLVALAGAAVALALVMAAVLVIVLPSRESSPPPPGAQTSFVTPNTPEPSVALASEIETPSGSGTSPPPAEGQGTPAQAVSSEPATVPVDLDQQGSPPPAIPSATPTASPRPTKKPAPTRTSPPTVSPTETPSHLAAPELTEPDDGATFRDIDRVMLRWHWAGTLGPDDHYDVRVWREGGAEKGITWTEEPFYELHFPSLPEHLRVPDPTGTYYWSIVVVRGQSGIIEEVVSFESDSRSFTWEGHTG